MPKLAIIATHPVQYNAPFIRLLAQRSKVIPKVFYTWEQSSDKQFDAGFGRTVKWNIPLTEGYDFEFTKNTASKPGIHHFWGIQNAGLIKAVENFSPNAILVFGWNYHSHFKVMRYFKNRIPIYFRGDSTLIDEQRNIKTILRRLWLKYVYSFINGAFYVGKNNYDYFKKHGLKDSQLFYAPHAIDNDRFDRYNDNQKEAKVQFRRKNNIPDNATLILFAGKFEPKKNPEILIDAFNKIKNIDLHLLMVGNGVLETELKYRSEDYSNIHFLPFQNQSEMPLTYQFSDLFVLPSAGPGETWGLAINEAMACGLPVIASNKAGCTRDLIIEGVNGYSFETGNTMELTEAISKIIVSRENLSQMGGKSREIIESFNFNQICEAIERVMLK